LLMDIIQELKTLYNKSSKHSNYQLLASSLCEYLDMQDMNISSRYEKERLDFILSELVIQNKIIMDIGGNTGYFTFELLNKGAKKIIYYEGNQVHSQFVRLGARLLNLENKISINNKYFNFCEKINEDIDIILLLNVLHHFGDEFGDKNITLDCAKNKIINALNNLANITKYLVFQMGFNWKGNKIFGFFANGSKKEMINFVKNGITNYWEIKQIGIAQKKNNVIKYINLNHENIARDDKLREFLNRPIFILKSIKRL